jgi:hypothetical protein
MSPPRPVADIQSDIRANNERAAALQVEIARLDAALKAARRELDDRSAGWGSTLATRLKDELAYAERYEDNRRHPEVPTNHTGHPWFVISLTPKQAKIRDDHGTEWTLRSGAGGYVTTLEACRVAWVRAGRELP